MRVESETDLDKIKSNMLNICLDCGCKIHIGNDSGWEAFIYEDQCTTQKLCIKCDDKRGLMSTKVEGR